MKGTDQRNESRDRKALVLEQLPAPIRGTFLCMENSDKTLTNVLAKLGASSKEITLLLKRPNIWYSGINEGEIRKVLNKIRTSIQDCNKIIVAEKNTVEQKIEDIKDTFQRLVLDSDEKVQSEEKDETESYVSIIDIVSDEDEVSEPESIERDQKATNVKHMIHSFRSRQLSVNRRLKSVLSQRFHGNKKIKVYSEELDEEKRIRFSRLRNFLYKNETYEVVEELEWRIKKRNKKRTVPTRATSLPSTPPDFWNVSF